MVIIIIIITIISIRILSLLSNMLGTFHLPRAIQMPKGIRLCGSHSPVFLMLMSLHRMLVMVIQEPSYSTTCSKNHRLLNPG